MQRQELVDLLTDRHKKTAAPRKSCGLFACKLDDGYFFCLRAFLSLSDSKLYFLSFIKRFKA